MPDVRRFLTRRWLVAFLGGAVLLFGLAMLHPYPRQSLFGPTIRGKPWCYWEGEVRLTATWERDAAKRSALAKRVRHFFRIDDEPSRISWNHSEMLPLFLKLAEDADNDVRITALWAIVANESLYQEPALSILRDEMRGGALSTVTHQTARVYAARGVWRITKDKDEVLPTLREALSTPRDKWLKYSFRRTTLQCEAIAVLGEIAAENPELMPEVLRFAIDEEEYVRCATMRAIASFGPRAIPTLIEGLGDIDKSVRGRAADSLQTMGSDARAAIPALDRLLGEPDRDIKKRVIKALVAIDPPRRDQLDRLWVEME